MKAAVCVQSDRVETYADVMAAIVTQYPAVREFEFVFLSGQDEEKLLKQIEENVRNSLEYEAYVLAERPARSTKKVNLLNKSSFKGCKMIDVTGISKELMSEIIPIAMASGQSICSLSWSDRINKERKYVGRDEYNYFDAMKSSVVQNIYKTQKAVWIMFYILSIIVFLIAFLYGSQLLGVDLISDKLINFLGILVGLAGLFLSYIALNFVPSQSKTGS
ncbi:hypothetical protein [Stappia sp. P2PMeth1]|uniref:hypothetical protein n=1 Tax=Stappia sp. P2PMeth1 TaxID=2003586 RepID=UPI001648148B|nr:hypothetical protein [Stappia sp. P2PMeth1]